MNEIDDRICINDVWTLQRGRIEHNVQMDRYKNNMSASMYSDIQGYSGLRNIIFRSFPEITNLSGCLSIGGGIPKLELSIGCKCITVIDPLGAEYSVLDDKAKLLYGNPLAGIYRINRYTDRYELAGLSPAVDITCMAHFMEHFTWVEQEMWLEAVKSRYCVIYGPCGDRAHKGWFHFKSRDHIAIPTVQAMKSMAERLGWEARAVQYSDDMLFVLRKPL